MLPGAAPTLFAAPSVRLSCAAGCMVQQPKDAVSTVTNSWWTPSTHPRHPLPHPTPGRTQSQVLKEETSSTVRILRTNRKKQATIFQFLLAPSFSFLELV